jgi:hypothetical protein
MGPPIPYEGLCAARTRNGQPCRRYRLAGRSRCRLHGGLSLIGPASPAWRHGRYSKIAFRYGISQAYEDARNDPNLLSLRNSIAVLELRIEELWGDCCTGNRRSTEHRVE